jgi:hypothetical protein
LFVVNPGKVRSRILLDVLLELGDGELWLVAREMGSAGAVLVQ